MLGGAGGAAGGEGCVRLSMWIEVGTRFVFCVFFCLLYHYICVLQRESGTFWNTWNSFEMQRGRRYCTWRLKMQP